MVYMYMIDLDMLDSLKSSILSKEEELLKIKTTGICLLEYNQNDYANILDDIGIDNASILKNRYLTLMDIRNLYESIVLNDENGMLRDFKFKIYRAINECKGIVILEEKEEEVNKSKSKKWFEFWK